MEGRIETCEPSIHHYVLGLHSSVNFLLSDFILISLSLFLRLGDHCTDMCRVGSPGMHPRSTSGSKVSPQKVALIARLNLSKSVPLQMNPEFSEVPNICQHVVVVKVLMDASADEFVVDMRYADVK